MKDNVCYKPVEKAKSKEVREYDEIDEYPGRDIQTGENIPCEHIRQ